MKPEKKEKILLAVTALMIGCGLIFYRTGVRDGQVKMMKEILRYTTIKAV